jgi:predicted Zn-dependent protease
MEEMKLPFPCLRCGCLAILLLASFHPSIRAQDESLDQLLKKLPPPEKLVKPRALAPQDPALQDPLVPQILAEIRAKHLPRALDLSRQLSTRNPKSIGALCLHGELALALRQLREAAIVFHRAIALEPKVSAPYFGLGTINAAEGHFSVALSNFQKVTALEPKSPIGWIMSGGCAERLGRKEEAAKYARRATEVSPAFVLGWLQLARAEKALGVENAALAATSESE